MTPRQFFHLDELEKFEVWYHAEFIGRRREGQYQYECRKIDNFYLEYKIVNGKYVDVCFFKNPKLFQYFSDYQ